MPRHALIAIAGTMLMAPLPLLADPSTPRAILDPKKLPTEGETIIWSPLFQASWEALQSMHVGKMEKVDPPNPIIEALEQFQWKKDDVMPPNGYAVYTGLDTSEFARKTAADVKKHFHFDMTINTLPQTGRAYATYGVLVRDLAFRKQFYRSKKSPLRFNDSTGKTHQVRFLGTAGRNSEGYGKNVHIISNDIEKSSFILAITTDKKEEKIIIYRPEKASSIANAIQHIIKCRKNPCNGKFGEPEYPYLWKGDVIKIPYLKIKAHTDFTSLLKGTRYYHSSSTPWHISRAYQITEFDLTDKGARIRLQTGSADAFGGTPQPRKFICDKPFFVFA